MRLVNKIPYKKKKNTFHATNVDPKMPSKSKRSCAQKWKRKQDSILLVLACFAQHSYPLIIGSCLSLISPLVCSLINLFAGTNRRARKGTRLWRGEVRGEATRSSRGARSVRSFEEVGNCEEPATGYVAIYDVGSLSR